MKKSRGFAKALILFYSAMAALSVLSFCRTVSEPAVSVAASSPKTPVIIIDAGHGGEDGGAVSPEGDRESEINLHISEDIELIFALLGRKTVMTRVSEDIEYPEEALTTRERKRADLKSRVEIANAEGNGLLLSIHQNKFSTCEPFGAQVLYTHDAAELAEYVQLLLRDTLDPSNYRSAAEASSEIYIMQNSKNPALLIECGFLSNKNDLRNLKSEEYRLKLSSVIAFSLISFYE